MDAQLRELVVEEVLHRHPQSQAVVLVGSLARGDAHEWSDIDVWAIGDGLPDYELSHLGDRLLSFSGATAAGVARSFMDPGECLQAVAAWRGAELLHDPSHVGEALRSRAQSWQWSMVEDAVPAWAAEKVTGLAEEVLKLIAANARGEQAAARVQASLIGLQLSGTVRTLRRELYLSENDLWRPGDDAWFPVLSQVLLDDEDTSTRAALQLWATAADLVGDGFDPRQRAVVDFTRGRAQAAGLL